MTTGIKKVSRPRKMSFPEGVYLVEIVKALGVTMGHLLRNLARQERIPTIEYPEVRRVTPPRVRGSPDPRVEKGPVRFDIDMLRCVYCGLCVEACPVDAIRMDTGWHTPPDDARGKLVFTIDTLLEKRG